jgi:fused signal recognition particle receptor
LLAGALLGFLACSAQAQYLRRIGPAPLVWTKVQPVHPGDVAILPPLIVLEPEPVGTTNAAVAPPPPAPDSVPTPPAVLAPPPELPASAPDPSTNGIFIEAASHSAEEPPAPAFPMETLAPFFSSAFVTNRSGGVTVPLSFSPPATPPQRSSTATYFTSPP